MQKSNSVVVDDLRIGPKLPDMKTAYSRCCRSVLWATSGVHLLAPPSKGTPERDFHAHVSCGNINTSV